MLNVAALSLVRLLQILGGFFLSALRIVLGSYSVIVLIHGTVALAVKIVDHSQVDMSPHLDPFRIQIAIQSLAEFVGSGLIVVLKEEKFGHPVVRQRTAAIHFQRLLILL